MAAPGCGDGDDAVCGPGDAPAAGVTATIPGATITYGDVTSSPNNDCPPDEGGPTSLTIELAQTGLAPGEGLSMVLCLPRPDEIDTDSLGAATVALDDERLVLFFDINARLADDCRLRRNTATLPSGTMTFAGYCDAGGAAEGYALTFDGTAPGRRICPDGAGGSTEEPVTIELAGTVAVTALRF